MADYTFTNTGELTRATNGDWWITYRQAKEQKQSMDIKIGEPLVLFTLVGSTYIDANGRLIVDDTDAVQAFKGKWGGLKQQGVLKIEWRPFVVESVEVRPDAGGAYAAPGEAR